MPKKKAESQVSDEALDQAAEQIGEGQEGGQEGGQNLGHEQGQEQQQQSEQQQSEQEQEQGQEEPTDHQTRSALGRKVKNIEDRLNAEMELISGKLDQLMDNNRTSSGDQGGEEEEFIPTTRKELDDYLNQRLQEREQQKTTASQQYNTTYLKTVGTYQNDEDYDAICKELDTNFNVRRSDNAEADAHRNYLEASRAYYRKKIKTSQKENPLKGNQKSDLPLGSGSENERQEEQETPLPKLDDMAVDFIKSTGMSEDSVKKALTGEPPLSLLRGHGG